MKLSILTNIFRKRAENRSIHRTEKLCLNLDFSRDLSIHSPSQNSSANTRDERCIDQIQALHTLHGPYAEHTPSNSRPLFASSTQGRGLKQLIKFPAGGTWGPPPSLEASADAAVPITYLPTMPAIAVAQAGAQRRSNIHFGIIVALLATLTSFAQPEKLIEELTITKNRLEVKINKEFKKAYLKDDFFIEYDEDIDLTKLDYSIVTLPFIMNVISLVWISGKDYSIDSMDQGVHDSLTRLKKLFRFFYPKTQWNGRLIPKKIVSTTHVKPYSEDSDGKTALLFSGGVDSISASFAHRDKQQLLITAWGQSCLPLDHPELWHVIKNHVIDFAKSYGHENSFIKSNYYYFLDFKKLCTLSPEIATWRIDTIEDIGWAGLVAPILVTKGIPTLHIASSDTWDFFYPSATNPFIDGNISFAGLKFKHDQFEMSRFDKIASIHNLCHHHLVEKPQLIICQQKGGVINCGTCEKCCCTLLGFLATGADPREYGYAIGPKKAIKRAKKCMSPETMGCFLIWQCIDIKKKNDLSKKTPYDLSWLNDIDFSKKIAYDLKDIEPVDLKALHKLFPAIELPSKNPQKAALLQIVHEAGSSEEQASKQSKLEQEKMASKAALLQSLQDGMDTQVATVHKPQQFAPEAVLTQPLVQIVHELHAEDEEFDSNDEFEEQEELETPTLWQRIKSLMSWLSSWFQF